jgi:hypothetical protein
MPHVGVEAGAKALEVFADELERGEITGGAAEGQFIVRVTAQRIAKHARELAERFRRSGVLE